MPSGKTSMSLLYISSEVDHFQLESHYYSRQLFKPFSVNIRFEKLQNSKPILVVYDKAQNKQLIFPQTVKKTMQEINVTCAVVKDILCFATLLFTLTRILLKGPVNLIFT